ncbi:hypothetical protein LPJ61_001292 [Coemansia biformis]|uniref:Uncharacterized protein n=1 Tax=Coemansia biformis TaxID=1286918 RepID=A0A9W8D0T2_9FUNG|nr:hypothetical protein LPJ61_001292 [Coemansia biformis]
METPLYEVIDVVPAAIAGSHSALGGTVAGSKASSAAGSTRNLASLAHGYARSAPHWQDRQADAQTSLQTHGIAQMAANLDRRYMLTEDTVLWTISSEYNVVFIIDISQSMYSLDPSTNNPHVQTALETLEKCLMGMVQPFTVQSALGLSAYEIEPHVCASVVGYCPRMPGAYRVDGSHKKLPFCRTLAHAHMVTQEGIPGFMKSIRNFLFNYESELNDSLGSFPPPVPHFPPATAGSPGGQRVDTPTGEARRGRSSRGAVPFETAAKSGKQPRGGDMYTFSVDADAPLLHTLQIADYFLQIMPEVCSPAFVYLTDGVMRSNFAISKAQSITSSLVRRNTRCTFVQVGSCGGFTPETTLGFVGDNELLLHLAASLGGHLVYASDCPDAVLPHRANFYHQVMLIKETRFLRTPVRAHHEFTLHGGRRMGDMSRERLDTRKDSAMRAVAGKDPGFPWCSDCKPPVVDTVVARYSDYNTPVSIGMLIEMRMGEGFIVRNVQVIKLDRDGLSERVSVKMELVWHPNITITYRITNTYYVGHGEPRDKDGVRGERGNSTPAASASSSASFDGRARLGVDRGQRGPNMVDISIRSYKQLTLEFLHHEQAAGRRNELANKAALLHSYLRAIVEKDEQLRLIHVVSLETLRPHMRRAPRVFTPPLADVTSEPRCHDNDVLPLASRVYVEDVDPDAFLGSASWGPEHHHLYGMMLQHAKPGSTLENIAGFQHTASLYIDPDLIMSHITGMDFTEMAKHGHRIMNDFRSHICQAGTWALLRDEGDSMVFLHDRFRQSHKVPVFVAARWDMITNWILRVSFSLFNGTWEARKIVSDCLPSFCYSFWPEYRTGDREVVVRTARPLHLLPVDLDTTEPTAPNLLSTRDMGDLHTYVLEWRWTYLAREGTREDLSGEGSDHEIVRQALHRLALTLGYYRLKQDFSLLNAKGPSTGLMDSPGASDYDSCITFYHEREGYDREELVLACQYQIVVDLKQSSVTARTWIEPWSARFVRMVFEDDFRDLAPLGTFQQILQPARCFQLKVPNLAEFHSQRMNMFSIMSVVNSSRLALRVLQMPDVVPAHAVWCPPEGTSDIKIDNPAFEITPGSDMDKDIEVHELDESGNVVKRTPAIEYYKTHGREETRQLVREKKLRLQHMGTKRGQRRAILLERFMLTLFDKSEEGKYDPFIEQYRDNEYNPFILALINPGHPRKLFFSLLTLKWMSTGEFTIVAYRCFLEFALFKRCDAISVNAERFNKLLFASSIVKEMSQNCDGLRPAAAMPNELDEHVYMDKWFVIRLPNNSSFLMVILPNTPLSWPKRRQGLAAAAATPACTPPAPASVSSQPSSDRGGDDGEQQQLASSTPSTGGSQSEESAPASPPVLTPALEQSIRGRFGADIKTSAPVAINGYTLVMECSMDNTEMHRHLQANGPEPPAPKSSLNLQPLQVPCTDTKVAGESFQGFVGHQDVPIPFTDYALAEIKALERMYSEAYLQTIYLALLLKREVALDDLVACQQSTLWKRRSIDVDITAFLHSQDAARISRGAEWQAQDGDSLQDKFAELLHESFTPLPHAVGPSQDRYYYCKSAPDRRSELELCLQVAQNPLFINFQCSVEVLNCDMTHDRRLNMPIDVLPLSLVKLCEQTGISWRPPTDHFEPLTNVRVIVHINCLYLPDESLTKDNGAAAEQSGDDQEKVLPPKPDEEQLASRSARLFQKTMSLSSLVTNEFDPASGGAAAKNSNALPSAVIAKQHTNAQMATLTGLPHDQLELVRHCHRRFVRFIAQETLYALRDIRPVTVPLLNQVWHTIATTVDDEVPSDKFEFSHNRIGLKFLTSTLDDAKRRHAIGLVMSELLKQDDVPAGYPLGKLQELGGIVYMRDMRSRSDRQEARARIRARALSDVQDDAAPGAAAGAVHRHAAAVASLSDAMPSWFLIKPTAAQDGVRILTHNYSVVTNEAVDNVMAATRQLLMVALKAANTRLLLEEMAETHEFPSQLVLPDAVRATAVQGVASSRLGSYTDTQDARGEIAASGAASMASPGQPARGAGGDDDGDDAHRGQPGAGVGEPAPEPASAVATPVAAAVDDIPAAPGQLPGDLDAKPSPQSDPYDIASVLNPYIPDNPDFYVCEEQFRATFPLHPRTLPSKAIQAVLASGMMNSRIINQDNMFFVRDKGAIFYALLTVDRTPFVSPFGPRMPDGSRQSASATAVPTPTADAATPACDVGAPEYQRHSVSLRQMVPSTAFLPGAGGQPLPDAQSAAMLQRRPSIVHAAGTASALRLATTAAELGGDGSGSLVESDGGRFGVADSEQPRSPRTDHTALAFGSGGVGLSVGDMGAQLPASAVTPGSPSNRHMVSSLAQLEGERSGGSGAHGREARTEQPRWALGRTTQPPSPLVSRSGQAGGAQVGQRLLHTVSITSMPVFDNFALSDVIPHTHAEERTVPCIVLHIYGVDKPSKDMTQSLVLQIGERITINVTIPEMSTMLLRHVTLNEHDMSFLFPQCNPEPAILYLPLPRFVHDLGRLLRHMGQAFGEIVSPFPKSDLLAKAVRRTLLHLREDHDGDGGDGDDDGKGASVAIGDRIPSALHNDLARVMEDWEYDGQTPRRVPLEDMTFLYNLPPMVHTAPPPEMTSIGTGIASISALPLSRERTLIKSIWREPSSTGSSSLAAQQSASAVSLGVMVDPQTSAPDDALMISTARRPSLAPYHRHAASFSSVSAGTDAAVHFAEQAGGADLLPSAPGSPLQRREQAPRHQTPCTPSLPTSSATPAAGEGLSLAADAAAPGPLPASEVVGLFTEYLRQFKEARKRLRVEPSEIGEVAELMDSQVGEFAGEPVLAIAMWSNTSVRLDRLFAYVSRMYWTALGEYVVEQVVYPTLSAGWGKSPDTEVRLPDPFKDLDSYAGYLSSPDEYVPAMSISVKMDTMLANEQSASEPSLAMLRIRDGHIPKESRLFTELSKKQVHVMDIARQMAQYWGSEDSVKSLRRHRRRLPRATGISHWFAEELRGVLETICPVMNPALFGLLENPLVLEGGSQSAGPAPKPLFPAATMRRPAQQPAGGAVYDVSSLPAALKGTRQSFCIMCTLPLSETVAQQQSHRAGMPSSRAERTPPGAQAATNMHNRRLESLMKRPGESGYQRPSARSSAAAGAGPSQGGQLHGLGLHGWNQGLSRPQLRHGTGRYPLGKGGDTAQPSRKARWLRAGAERETTSYAEKSPPAPSDYKPIADPAASPLSAGEIAYYTPHSKAAPVSTIAWVIIWLVGGELEMVGYNVSQRLWDEIHDQIKQRTEREDRRKQLLGMLVSHMAGIFPGYDRQARHKGISSAWMDRDVTRDLVNKYAPLGQIACADQIHYFKIERQLSADYMRELGLYEGSDELRKLVCNPPVPGMTMNDLMTELVLRQLQPEHLRWARKLTFADYTQPYVDTQHPDTLFRVGSRFLRAYQGRIHQVLRYDEMMRIAERWRQLAIANSFKTSAGRVPRMLMMDVHASDTHTSSSDDHRLSSRSVSAQPADASARATPSSTSGDAPTTAAGRLESPPQAPLRGDRDATHGDQAAHVAQELPPAATGDDSINGVTLEAIRMIMGNARLLHYVCAPLPLSSSIRPDGTDRRSFDRLFRAISAMLQNLTDCYIDYLCSMGFIVARRYESIRPWKSALAGLGYAPAKIAQLTGAILGDSRGNSFSHSARAEQGQAALPGIQVPGAYLFADTERSNLITDVEVSPEMLSIRMYALNRFTSEWRSAVPGYVRTPVNLRTSKKFTFELSKYKKLLHVKSFTYDFQLRYIASLLKHVGPASLNASGRQGELATGPGGAAGPNADLHTHPADMRPRAGASQPEHQQNIYSSDSDAGDTDSAESSDEDSDEDAGDAAASNAAAGEAQQASRTCKRTVAEALHVHVDITIFLDALSQQRYYSTRFSTRRLVRAQHSVMHLELFEYFLGHCERYHFYTKGCRPLAGQQGHGGPGQPMAAADLCPTSALHSGCYRLYEDALPDAVHAEATGNVEAFGALSDPSGYAWMPQSGERHPLHLSESGGPVSRSISIPGAASSAPGGASVAASAPEPTWKLPCADGSSGGASSHRARPLMIRGHGGAARTGTGAGPSDHSRFGAAGGRAHPSTHRQTAASYAASAHWGDGSAGARDGPGPSRGIAARMLPTGRAAAAAVTAGQYINVHATEHPVVPSRSAATQHAGSLSSDTNRERPYAHGSQGSAEAHRDGSASRLAEFALSEYSACKIHLLSSDTMARVSLMALTPTCNTCQTESSLEARRRKERLHTYDEQRGGATEGRETGDAHGHGHHGRRRHGHGRHSKRRTGDGAGGDSKGAARSHRCRRRHGAAGAARPIDDLGSPLGSQRSYFPPGQGRTSHLHDATGVGAQGAGPGADEPAGSVRAGHAPTRSTDTHSWRDERTPLQRWMGSLSSDAITDPQADGLRGRGDDMRRSLVAGGAGTPAATASMAQLSYYLVVDMDPQTTVGLNSLRVDGHRSRNGSLGPAPESAEPSPNLAGSPENMTWTRTCAACTALHCGPGQLRLCGIHKALRAARVDMRDWESKGEVWASDPAILMDTSTVDPDEFDKEDPDVLQWIKRTVKRVIRHTAADYHRDLNWYRAYQHMRMANLPPNLAPQDVSALFDFAERQTWIDVGAIDGRVQQLLDLDIPAQDIVQSLQLRMQRLYLESALLMTTLQADSGQVVPPAAGSGQRPSSSRRPPLEMLGRAMASAARLNATPPATPNVSASFGLSRYSTIDQSVSSGAERGRKPSDESQLPGDTDMHGMVNAHVLPSSPLSPVAAVGADGRVLRDCSSSDIDDVFRLLLPLGLRPGRRLLLDPAFQKVLSSYIRLELTESPWLCRQHKKCLPVPSYTWSLDETSAPTAVAAGAGHSNEEASAGANAHADVPGSTTGAGGHSVHRRMLQVHDGAGYKTSSISSFRRRDRLGRSGASISSLGTGPARSTTQDPAMAASGAGPLHASSAHRGGDTPQSLAARGSEALGSSVGASSQQAAGLAGPHAVADRFAQPRVESQPGTLFVVEPGDGQVVARLLVLNPFAYHGMLELLFERTTGGGSGGVKLSQIRSIARERRRSGLYDYERKHINMVLSTIAATVWDVVTREAGE